MAEIIPFVSAAGGHQEEDYFGGCPVCGGNDGFLNSGPAEWFVCLKHGVKWFVGANLFSDWWDEDEATRQKSADTLSRLSEVVPRRLAGAAR